MDTVFNLSFGRRIEAADEVGGLAGCMQGCLIGFWESWVVMMVQDC